MAEEVKTKTTKKVATKTSTNKKASSTTSKPTTSKKETTVKKETVKQVETKKVEETPKVEKKEKVVVKSNKFTSRLKEKYNQEVRTQLVKKFNYKSVMQAPKLEKIVINVGVGDAVSNAKALDETVSELTIITGQKPVITKAKKSIANFKLREGTPIGAKVTLRGEYMYSFFDKLTSIALPRVRDFRGVSKNSFDGRGNYTLGVKEQLIFPEIDYDKVSKIRGMDIVIVTTAKTDEEAQQLLSLLGMPFQR